MKNDKLEKLNKIQEEIDHLDRFLRLVCRDYNAGNYGYGFFNKMFIRKRYSLKNISIIGKYFFGLGTHEEEINMPQSILLKIEKIVWQTKKDKEDEFNAIINNNKP